MSLLFVANNLVLVVIAADGAYKEKCVRDWPVPCFSGTSVRLILRLKEAALL